MNLVRSPMDPATLLVGISNPATAHGLVEICSTLSMARSLDILLAHVVTVANQISLTTGRSSPEVVRARDFVGEVQRRAEAREVHARGLVEVARSVDEGLLAAAESHRAGMILVGYSEWIEDPDGGDEGEFDRTMYRVVRKAHTDVVVAKLRREAVHRVLVPVGTDSPMDLVAFLARAFSMRPDSSVTFLHVAGSKSPVREARNRLERWLEDQGLEGAGRMEVIQSNDPGDALLQRSHDHDLVIVGPSKRPGIMGGILPSKARTLAESTRASALVAWGQDPQGAW